MDDWEIWEKPDEVRLSLRERLVLARIEAGLRQDRRFAHRMGRTRRMGWRGRMRRMGRTRRGGRTRRTGRARREVWLPAAVLLLTVASVFVAVMGIRTSDPALLWCFALLWPLTLLQAFRLLCRAARARSGHGSRLTPWL
ncbi:MULTISPECIES: DUF3040 domain-containing protein [Streptomyces]|uniref:DUF3040 domain-containing protein n=1 Tax=Streptomyces TaxID=1883 RepID=UPI00166FA537|nr:MULTISPECIES: DUF3040 domain-containing protein [Streptomyces]UFR06366.1 DUF3040 domain-containing protein [Streptomyces sp. Go40/10]GGS61137.1 hypothetical protein GCM10010206_23880 [Streptomyces cinerochromogenes]